MKWPALSLISVCLTILFAMSAACGGEEGDATTTTDNVATTAEATTSPDRTPEATQPSSTQAPSQSGASASPTAEAEPAASGGIFIEAGLLEFWDTNTDPSVNFTTSFRTSDEQIDVAFKVSEAGEVYSAWIYEGQWVALPGDITLDAEANVWTSFTFTPRSGEAGFRAGDYEVILGKLGSPDTLTFEFTIEQEASDATFEQAGLSTDWDASVEPDPDTFTTSFLPDDGRVYAVFQLGDDGGQVESVWRYEGDELVFEDQPKVQIAGGGWGVLFLSAPELPAGSYESVLSITGTDREESLTFTVEGDPVSPQFEEAGLVSSIDQVPVPEDFKDIFPTSSEKVYAAFKLSDEGAVVWMSQLWRYEGLPISWATTSGVDETGTWFPPTLTAGSSGLPSGDYEVVLTVLGTSVSETLSFAVE